MTRPQWSTACIDWADRLQHGRSIIPPPIYPDQAARALEIFKSLRVVDLPGRPTFGECCEEWVFDFVAAIFGAYDAETGDQLIREFYLLISKKNTKSTIAAGIMLTALLLCWREEEEHLILAPTKEVADNSFKPAAAMVRADDDLADLLHVQDHVRTITHRTSRNSLKVVAADTETVSGKKSGRVLVDEHWLFGKKANAGAMFIEALGGQVSRNEGWVIYLTTQADDAPAGVFKEKLTYFREVRDGRRVDQRSLGVLYEFPPEMVKSKAYLKPENFHITNPNLGRSVSREWLEDQISKHEGKIDGTYQQFLAKHLNIEIGLALMSDRWSGADHWERNGDPLLTLDALLARSEVVTLGIDAGGSDDLMALAVLGRERDTGRWLAWCHCWVKRSVLELRKSEAPRLEGFQADGDLTITEDLTQQITALAALVEKVRASGLMAEKGIGVDRARIEAILDELNAVGIGDEQVQAVPQNWTLMGPIIACDRKLTEGNFVHADQPIMAWAVSNAKVETHKNAFTITKQASGTAKIDPLMAVFDAAALMARNPEPMNGAPQIIVLELAR